MPRSPNAAGSPHRPSSWMAESATRTTPPSRTSSCTNPRHITKARALVICRGFVQLLVLLGGVVRVADSAIHELGRCGDPAAFGDLGIAQDLQNPVHQSPSARAMALASSRDFSAADRS